MSSSKTIDKQSEYEKQMESLSRKSSESSTNSCDYVMVVDKSLKSPILMDGVSESDLHDAISSNNLNMISHSISYDDFPSNQSPSVESPSFQKPDTDEDTATLANDQQYMNDGNFTIFSNVLYLGSAVITVPKSEAEILHHINELNTSSGKIGVNVKISIPNSCNGQVVLYEEDSDAVFSSFDIQFILFYARGAKETANHPCFAFSWSHLAEDSQEVAIYQCHVFRCKIPEAVKQVSACFAKAFQRVPHNVLACSKASENFMINSVTSDISENNLSQAVYEFFVSLEIKEKDTKSVYTNVIREKNCFKLRQNCDKEICITIKPAALENIVPLVIERCFGVLLLVGKIKKQSDMQLLEFSGGSNINGSSEFQIIAKWDLNAKAFEHLKNEPQKSHLVTFAVDLVVKGIQEPVRFVIETLVKIENSETQSSRFSNSFLFQVGNKRPMLKKFYLQFKENEDNCWILSIDPSDECFEPAQSSSSFNQKFKNFSKMVRSASAVSFEFDELTIDEHSELIEVDEDEPLASGTGEVSKDCTQEKLDSWSVVIQEWQSFGKRPKNLAHLIRNGGIPHALRCQIWQKLSYIENRPDLIDKYRVLITKDTKCEDIILRDVNRTFPGHDFFRDDSLGQESLYKVSKAYSVYDQEVGYCQGLSFIAASLVLLMPEEEAFSVLVAIMFDFGLRELYKENFENLSLKLFQLTCLLRDQQPDLYEHFMIQKIELHMFASQWFLTLFTARFPLPFVFQCIDFYLLDGINVLVQISFALLSVCKKELLTKDFESILKYIRVSLPKKIRSESQAAKLIKLASEVKVKKLKKYEAEYLIQKEENDKFERLLSHHINKYNEDRKVMQNEISQLQRKIRKYEADEKKYESIILDYKQIIQRQEQLDIKSSLPAESKDVKELGNLKLCSLELATNRIRELEMELAQAKVAQAESECQNQSLHHQLNAIIAKTSIQHSTNTPYSWKDKLFNNIPSIPTFQSHISEIGNQLTSFDEKK